MIDKCFEELESKYGEGSCWFKVDPEQNGFVADSFTDFIAMLA